MLADLITQLMISTHYKQVYLPPANVYPFCISALLLFDGKPAPKQIIAHQLASMYLEIFSHFTF